MHEPPEALATPATPATTDIPCLRCGHSLRGLPVGGVCPKCALPIVWTMRRRNLAYASTARLQTMVTGFAVAEVAAGIGMLALLIVGISAWFPALFQPGLIFVIFGAGWAVSLGGWWRATASEARHPTDDVLCAFAWITRLCVVIWPLAFLIVMLDAWLLIGLWQVGLTLVGLCGAVAFAWRLLYIFALGCRMPGRWVRLAAVTCGVVAPAALLTIYVTELVGPILAWLSWIVLLDTTRRSLRATLRESLARTSQPAESAEGAST